MGYYVDFDSLFAANCTAKQISGQWATQVGEVSKRYGVILSNNAFSGEAADHIKSYVQEVHGVILASIQELLANYFTKVSLYTDGYMKGIDTNIHAVLPETDLNTVRSKMKNLIESIESEKRIISRSASNISDLVRLDVPAARSAVEGLSDANDLARKLHESVLGFESAHANDFAEIDVIILNLRQLIDGLMSENRSALIHYKSGGIAALTDCVALRDALQVSMEYRTANMPALEAANEHDKLVIEQLQREAEEAAAKQRLEQGIWTGIAAIGAIVVGAVAIVATAGAATPAVAAGVFYVAGACSAAYGVSNAIQAGQDIYYGAVGDPYTAAFNPLRDTVFMGNQSAYDTWGSLNMIVAGLAVPVNAAFNAAHVANTTATMGSVGRVVATELGKDAISGVAGKYAGQLATELTGNEHFGTIVGIGTGIGASIILGKLDEKLNISGLYDPNSVAAYQQAKDIRADAIEAESDVTEVLKGMEGDDCYLEGLENRIKGEDSLTRKIYNDAIKDHAYLISDADSNIGDSLRYTMIAGEDNYCNVVQNTLDELQSQGYKVIKYKNTWDNDVYKGINVNLETPDGKMFELQFHTKSSFYTKETLNHQYYEIARSKTATDAEIEAANSIMKQNTSTIPIPDGVIDFQFGR